MFGHKSNPDEDRIWNEEFTKNNIEDLECRLSRTVNAAYFALLEITAWMGIPEHNRHKMIKEMMENVKYCAENDLRKFDKKENKHGKDQD